MYMYVTWLITEFEILLLKWDLLVITELKCKLFYLQNKRGFIIPSD